MTNNAAEPTKASTPKGIVKVAAVQAAPVAFDLEKSLEKVEQLTTEAAQVGAQIVVFPEAFLSAYPWRYAFDATVGTREPRGRKWYAKYYDSSVAIPSPEFDVLAKVAKSNSVCLQVGIVEKAAGTLYCTAVLLGPNGETVSRPRKLIPTACERLIWGQGAGDGLQVAETSIGKVGGLTWSVFIPVHYLLLLTPVTWENYMPAARMALYQQGIELYLAPNADDLRSWIASMQHIAKEGRCFVISVNQFCKVSAFPLDYPPFTEEHHDRQADGSRWEPDSVLDHGGSCIVGPLGEFIAKPVWDKEVIIYADLKMTDLVEARMDFDAIGSYSRPDIFSLHVHTKPATNVSFDGQ